MKSDSSVTRQALNLVLIGNGHYVTGQTLLSGNATTDKDYGVLLPSAFHLRANGMVNKIAVCGRDGNKFKKIRDRIDTWKTNPGIDISFDNYPETDTIDDKAYLRALDEIPKPCAALIAVPDETHVEVMLECARRDIPFLIVKPAVTRLNDFYEIKAAMQNKLLGMVDYHKVYDEANLLLHDDISCNAYGNIHHISSLMSQRRDMIDIYKRWLTVNPSFNINHYLGSHYIHLTGFLTKATPIDVRATQQFGFIKQQYKLNVADTIQTQIRWKSSEGYIFASNHIAGWSDPTQTESMTYQQLHLLTENGHVFSDQRFRGTRKVLATNGMQAPNPHFFNFSRNIFGGWNLETKYGYQSVLNFVRLVLSGSKDVDSLHLPTINESENVTAILEAADISLSQDSCIVQIKRDNKRLVLQY